MADISKLTLPNNSTYNLKDFYAMHKTPDHAISGAAGWYRFFTTSLLLGTSNKIIFLITETYGTVRSAIIIAYLNRTSTTGANSACTLNMLSGVSLYSDFGYTIDGDSISLYYNKFSNSNGNVAIQVLYSENRLGNTYIDLTEKWENVSISSIPSEMIYANPLQDGNGNVIKDTYADKHTFGVCSTAAATAAKEVTISGVTELYDGLKIQVEFVNENSAYAAVTLNVNSLGAKNVYAFASVPVPNYFWCAGEVVELVYLSASSAWLIVGGGMATTTYYGKVKLNNTVTSTSATQAATASTVKTAYDAAVAAKPKGGSITLSLSWSGSGPYTQTVTVTGATVTSNSKVDLQPTAAQIAQLIADGVEAVVVENNAGTLTAYSLGATPSAAMTIACTVTEVTT